MYKSTTNILSSTYIGSPVFYGNLRRFLEWDFYRPNASCSTNSVKALKANAFIVTFGFYCASECTACRALYCFTKSVRLSLGL